MAIDPVDLEIIESLDFEGLKKAAIEAYSEEDPIETCLKQPLSDIDFYSLKLGYYLPSLLIYKADPTPNETSIAKYQILVDQARFLMINGDTEVISRQERGNRYGDDKYIASRILLCQNSGDDVKRWDDFLWRIGSNADIFSSTLRLNDERRQQVIDFVQRRFNIQLNYPGVTMTVC